LYLDVESFYFTRAYTTLTLTLALAKPWRLVLRHIYLLTYLLIDRLPGGGARMLRAPLSLRCGVSNDQRSRRVRLSFQLPGHPWRQRLTRRRVAGLWIGLADVRIRVSADVVRLQTSEGHHCRALWRLPRCQSPSFATYSPVQLLLSRAGKD